MELKNGPAHWLEWRAGTVRSAAYWNLPYGHPKPTTLGAAREDLDHLLQQSVREHLLSDVSLGVWLSGGIDSSTILHYASAAHASRLKTFSLTFRDRNFRRARNSSRQLPLAMERNTSSWT